MSDIKWVCCIGMPIAAVGALALLVAVVAF
jgi:hypothetical protein